MSTKRPMHERETQVSAVKFEHKTLGDVFTSIMKREDIKSYQDFAEAVDLSDVTVGRICRGTQETLAADTLYRISTKFRIPLTPLLLLNQINDLSPALRARVEASPNLFSLLVGSDTNVDMRQLPVFSTIRLPLSVFERDRKKGHSVAQILSDHAREVSGNENLAGKHLRGDKFVFRFNGYHMSSSSRSEALIPNGSDLLIQEVEFSDIKNGDLVLVQLLPVGKQRYAEDATVYAYERRNLRGGIYEHFRPSNTDEFVVRPRHTSKFGTNGQRELAETRIIYGRVVEGHMRYLKD